MVFVVRGLEQAWFAYRVARDLLRLMPASAAFLCDLSAAGVLAQAGPPVVSEVRLLYEPHGDLWSAASLAVIPSTHLESVPLYVVEALAAGVPCLATDTPAVRELRDLLVPDGLRRDAREVAAWGGGAQLELLKWKPGMGTVREWAEGAAALVNSGRTRNSTGLWERRVESARLAERYAWEYGSVFRKLRRQPNPPFIGCQPL